MKEFFKRYSYPSVILFVNQIAIAIFGLVLALSAQKADNEALKIVTSVFSIIFMLFLQFIGIWKAGAEDRISIDLGKRELDMRIPFVIWLIGNSINLLMAILYTVGYFVEPLSALMGVKVIALLIEGEYTGLLSIDVGGIALNNMWYMYFLITLPSLAAVVLGYLAGVKNITARKFFGKTE